MLNKRVWTVFEKAGFATVPNSTDPKEEYKVKRGKGRPLDLYAEVAALDVKIIGSNKSGKQASATSTWTGHMSDMESLRKEVGADKALLVAVHHELDPADLEYAENIGLVVWTEEKLAYFEELAESIGPYAKYEIIQGLGIKTSEEKKYHKVFALKINQPDNAGDTEMFVFSLSPENLLKTSVIYRRAQGNANAYQRMLKRSRLGAIAKFVEQSDAILPTDIILHLDDSVSVKTLSLKHMTDESGVAVSVSNDKNYCPVVLDIPMTYASMEIIDGQHRLYAFVKAVESVRENFNLVVVGIKKLTNKQKQETFVAINDNSRRMDPNLVSYLRYTKDDALCQNDPALMAIRVVVEMNKQEPFKKAIRLLDVGKETMTLKGLSGYDLKALLGKRGLLRKFNTMNDPNEYIRMIRTYFSVFRSNFKKEWNDPSNYLLATNRGASGLLKLLKSILKYEGNFPSERRIDEYAKALKKHWSWDATKLKRSYVGGQGWKEFHTDLVKAIRKESAFKAFKE